MTLANKPDPTPGTIYCLRCGEALTRNAKTCPDCGQVTIYGARHAELVQTISYAGMVLATIGVLAYSVYVVLRIANVVR